MYARTRRPRSRGPDSLVSTLQREDDRVMDVAAEAVLPPLVAMANKFEPSLVAIHPSVELNNVKPRTPRYDDGIAAKQFHVPASVPLARILDLLSSTQLIRIVVVSESASGTPRNEEDVVSADGVTNAPDGRASEYLSQFAPVRESASPARRPPNHRNHQSS